MFESRKSGILEKVDGQKKNEIRKGKKSEKVAKKQGEKQGPIWHQPWPTTQLWS